MTPTQDAGYRELLDRMLAAAQAGAEVIRDGAARRETLLWQSKGAVDYLTEVDTRSEARIRDLLLDAFPDAHMLGEEGWQGETVGRGLWFVADPLDGTTNFLHGVMEYAVSIAALVDGELVAGVVLNAARGDVYTALKGAGTHRDGQRVQVSSTTIPARALIATGFPFGGNADLDTYAAQFIPIARATAGIRRAGAAALDFANVASGRYDAFWELSLAPWDFAAGMLMIREAGGVVTDLDGNEAHVVHGGLIAGNPVMHEWVLNQLRDAKVHTGTRSLCAGAGHS
jgi:myo-inositol-1(or 4)-monophosphatase